MEEKKLLNEKEEGRYGLKGSRLWGALLFLLLLLVDQITKLVADVYFVDMVGANDRIPIIDGMLELCISYNRGIAFSSFESSSEAFKIGIVAVTGVMMIALALFYCKVDKRRTLLRVALVLIVAGGVGNLIDRVYYRVWDPETAAIVRDGVRDMVRVNIVFDFGVCNFADFFITGGAVLLILALLFFDTDAVFPMGKKYKALAKEAEERAEKKAAEKKARKENKTE
ncbi:MAG: signal peptidase II [Clostridia bacterium]|nr:signal peptidase II [Clostridia bacterium]